VDGQLTSRPGPHRRCRHGRTDSPSHGRRGRRLMPCPGAAAQGDCRQHSGDTDQSGGVQAAVASVATWGRGSLIENGRTLLKDSTKTQRNPLRVVPLHADCAMKWCPIVVSDPGGVQLATTVEQAQHWSARSAGRNVTKQLTLTAGRSSAFRRGQQGPWRRQGPGRRAARGFASTPVRGQKGSGSVADPNRQPVTATEETRWPGTRKPLPLPAAARSSV